MFLFRPPSDDAQPRRPSTTTTHPSRPFPTIPYDDADALSVSTSPASSPASPQPVFTPDSPHRPTSWTRTDPFYAPGIADPPSPSPASRPLPSTAVDTDGDPNAESESRISHEPTLGLAQEVSSLRDAIIGDKRLPPSPSRQQDTAGLVEPPLTPPSPTAPTFLIGPTSPAAPASPADPSAAPPSPLVLTQPPSPLRLASTSLPVLPAPPTCPVTPPSPTASSPRSNTFLALLESADPTLNEPADPHEYPLPMPTAPLSIKKNATAPRRTRDYSRPQVHDITEELGETGEGDDFVHVMGAQDGPTGAGVLGAFDRRLDRSVLSLGARQKAEKVLGTGPQPMLTSLYLVSGLAKEPDQWTLADAETVRGVQPLEDSLGVFWRPDMLGNTFSGEKSEDWSRDRKAQRGTSINIASVLSKGAASRALPGAGPDGASKLVARTLKYAHPKDVEVINSTLAPPTTCHTFHFTIPRRSTLKAVVRAGRAPPPVQEVADADDHINTFASTASYGETTTIRAALLAGGPSREDLRKLATGGDLTFYGATLTVWSHADRDRATKLQEVKRAAEKQRLAKSASRGRRWRSGASGIDLNESSVEDEAEAMGMAKVLRRTQQTSGSRPTLSAGYSDSMDVFWMPYAITLVSQYPIYDVMQDYLRLSWARYSKDARNHMKQICRILNQEAPRVGEIYRLPVGSAVEDEVILEGVMPGQLDFENGVPKVDWQMWPLFQALDIDHIITCVEIALSHSGRVVFYSRHLAMLGVAVNTLKYLVELRGWRGIAIPLLHARDCTFMIEDPGPYIVGVPTECRYLLRPPPEVAIVDIDMNTLALKSPPLNVMTPRQKREKAKFKILAALGPTYSGEKIVPMEYKVSYPRGSFRNINRVVHVGTRPAYLAERLRPPEWWRQADVVSIFDKIMADKKPTLLQRLTGASAAKHEAQLTRNEQLAKEMMRKRALHYVETRDDFDLKVARINRRLQKLVEEGEHWKKQFEVFERYAERLTQESSDLRNKIEREKREARRLSAVAHEQDKVNSDLHEQLTKTEIARAEAMRQLSDMNQSIQDLERERDEIMNVIERQITNALESMPLDDGSEFGEERPNTPTDSIASGTQSAAARGRSRKKYRPSTRDSARSAASNFTVESQPVSVLAAARGSVRQGVARPTTSGNTASPFAPSARTAGISTAGPDDAVRAVDRLLVEKTGSIAERVALIQAKLELALSAARLEPLTDTEDADDSTETLDEDEANKSEPVLDATVTPNSASTLKLVEPAEASPVSPLIVTLVTPAGDSTSTAMPVEAHLPTGSVDSPETATEASVTKPIGRVKAGRDSSVTITPSTLLRASPPRSNEDPFSRLFARVAAENAKFDTPPLEEDDGGRSSYEGGNRSSSSGYSDDDLADVREAMLADGEYVITHRMSVVSQDKASVISPSPDEASLYSQDKASVYSQDRLISDGLVRVGEDGKEAGGGLKRSVTSVTTVTFGVGGQDGDE